MKKWISGLLITGLLLGAGTASLQAQPKSERKAEKEELDKRAKDINDTVQKEKKEDLAIRGVSNETGVPQGEVERMYRKHKTAAGVLIACVMADETKRPPEEFLEKRSSGKTWTAMANDNHVSMDKINERLAHLERDLAKGSITDEKRVKVKRKRVE
jgi:redox-regulated HSP33 family molecular chaperone